MDVSDGKRYESDIPELLAKPRAILNPKFAVPREWTRREIDDEIRENGIELDVNLLGFSVLRMIGFEAKLTHNLAWGQFVIGEEVADVSGEMVRGIVEYIAEDIGSAAAAFSSESGRVVGLELNMNHLQSAYLGQRVTAIARSLKNGRTVQVWEIRFESSEEGSMSEERVLIAGGRLTCMVQSTAAMDKLATRSRL